MPSRSGPGLPHAAGRNPVPYPALLPPMVSTVGSGGQELEPGTQHLGSLLCLWGCPAFWVPCQLIFKSFFES